LQKYGWPKIADIGLDGQNNFWLLVQHADQDIHFQQAALREMEKLKGSKAINMENYAFLKDRVLCNLNWKQVYGTQVVWTQNGLASGFRPIIREDLANDRRRQLGMLPLSTYSLAYGFNYQPVNTKEAFKRDAQDLVDARKLIDSATGYSKQQEYQRAYDAYNNASTIAGGMDDEQNYQAAIFFARIAANDPDPEYKSIALDFLGLLEARETLTKKQLQNPVFGVLKSEPRWIDLLKSPYLITPQ
jgi:hypothetical protein